MGRVVKPGHQGNLSDWQGRCRKQISRPRKPDIELVLLGCLVEVLAKQLLHAALRNADFCADLPDC